LGHGLRRGPGLGLIFINIDNLFLEPSPVVSVHQDPGLGGFLVIHISAFQDRYHRTPPEVAQGKPPLIWDIYHMGIGNADNPITDQDPG
jgi:hypothetical protein